MHGNHTRLAQHDRTITQRDTAQVTCTENDKNGEGSMTLGTAPRHGVLRSRNRLIGVAAITSAALTLTACSSSGKESNEAKPSASSPSKSVAPSRSSDPDAALKKELLSVYAHYRKEQAAAYAQGKAEGTDVRKYATAEAYGKVMGDLLNLRRAGNLGKGAPTSRDPQVVGLNLSAKTPQATLKDCLDVTDWKVVNRKTGAEQPSPKGALKRHINDVKLEKWGKKWFVVSDEAKATGCDSAASS